MARLTLENAWVEFPVSLTSGARARISRTGGQIDSERSVVTALRDISFELREGERLGLMGHNGAGKSTMLRLLAGAYPPTRGRITSIGRISTLFNSTPGLSVDGTGRENIVTCGLHLGLSWRQINSKMEEIIDFAELGDYIDLPVRIYSSGMLTRLGFSIATAVEPEILLLDEGLATGDAQFAIKAEKKLNDLIARTSILVIASHSEMLLAKMCNRCLLLEHGSIVADGPAQQLLNSYRASVVERARADDSVALHRAYTLANEMAKTGELPPLDLEEQGLRYALKLAPDDISMWLRYTKVLEQQGKSFTVPMEVSMILAFIASDHGEKVELKSRLLKILATSGDELPDSLRERAVAAAGEMLTAPVLYRASIVERAHGDDPVALQGAYALANDMIQSGETPPFELEEQGLRYALGRTPDDLIMWLRYATVLEKQGKSFTVPMEVSMILAFIAADHSEKVELKSRLMKILATFGNELPDSLRKRAIAAAGEMVKAPE